MPEIQKPIMTPVAVPGSAGTVGPNDHKGNVGQGDGRKQAPGGSVPRPVPPAKY